MEFGDVTVKTLSIVFYGEIFKGCVNHIELELGKTNEKNGTLVPAPFFFISSLKVHLCPEHGH